MLCPQTVNWRLPRDPVTNPIGMNAVTAVKSQANPTLTLNLALALALALALILALALALALATQPYPWP